MGKFHGELHFVVLHCITPLTVSSTHFHCDSEFIVCEADTAIQMTTPMHCTHCGILNGKCNVVPDLIQVLLFYCVSVWNYKADLTSHISMHSLCFICLKEKNIKDWFICISNTNVLAACRTSFNFQQFQQAKTGKWQSGRSLLALW